MTPEKKKVLVKSSLICAGMVMTEGIAMSGILHRSDAHKSVKVHPKVRFVGEVANWLFSGMKPLEWKVTHLTHHKFEDKEQTPEQLHDLQMKYPGAPKEVFRDPHSPIMEGFLKVLFLNGLVYYRRATKTILPYLVSLESQGVDRELWPPHLKDVDLTQSKFDQAIDKIPGGRLLGMVAVGGILAATVGKETAKSTMMKYVPAVLLLGGGVNSLGHTGQVNNWRERVMVFLGFKQPIPDENGSYASNFLGGNLGFVAAGEENHADHHKNPGNPFITSSTNPLRDPTGVLLRKLSEHSLDGEPLVSFPDRRT